MPVPWLRNLNARGLSAGAALAGCPQLVRVRGDRRGVKSYIYKCGPISGTSWYHQRDFGTHYQQERAVNKVTRLRPKRRDVILEGLQLALDFGDEMGLKQATKDDIAQAVGRLAPPEKWGFIMLNPDQQRAVLAAVDAGPRPNETLRVWMSCISFIAYDRDGEIMAGRAQIAEAANVPPQHTSTALSRLVEIGALERIGRGRFRVNPHVGWSGPLHKRENAAKDAAPVQFTVFDGGKS